MNNQFAGHWQMHRPALESLLARELAVRSPDHEVSVLLVDIDGFREFNDALGPTSGDELLQLVAARIKALAKADQMPIYEVPASWLEQGPPAGAPPLPVQPPRGAPAQPATGTSVSAQPGR